MDRDDVGCGESLEPCLDGLKNLCGVEAPVQELDGDPAALRAIYDQRLSWI